MAMLTITGSTTRMRTALLGIGAIGRNPEPVLEAASLGLVRNVHQRFEAGEDPDGRKWADYAPLNPVYALTKEGPSILIGMGGFRSGLAGSITGQARGNVLVIGSNKIYAAVHQFGAIIQPKDARQLSFSMGGRLWHLDSVDVPARPYLGFSERDHETVVDALELFLAASMRG